MRRPPILPLILGLSFWGCSDPVDPPADGTLAVSTATSGDDPDPDGFQLRIDGIDSLALLPSGTAELDLSPGRHTLQLVGVAEHCSVAPGSSVEVDIGAGRTTPVAFEVTCPLTGVRVTVTTSGLDLDPDGYRLVMDASDQGAISANNIVTLRRLEAGSRTIALAGLAPNCAVDGPTSRIVTVVTAQVAAVEFAVVCTATSGVIGVIVSSGEVGFQFAVTVDGETPFNVSPNAPRYLGVPAGTHVVSLGAPNACSVQTGSQSVTVTAGTLVRDTAEVTFSVTCVSGFRITTRTTGPIPRNRYTAVLCTDSYCDNLPVFVGRVRPNDTLLLQLDTGTYWVGLTVNSHCVKEQTPLNPIRFVRGTLVDVEFRVTCS